MAEQGDRWERDEFKKDETDRELYPEPDSPPEEVEIISPSLITLDWPSFDLQSSQFGDIATKAYVDYMLGEGPETFQAKISADREAFLAVDYVIKGAGKWDLWEYQGPMSLVVESKFHDKPLESRGKEDFPRILEACFRKGGYDETDAEMQPYEEILSSLRLSMYHQVTAFDAEPLVVPLKGGKMASMSREDFIQGVLERKPKVYIYWRG